MAPRTIDIVVNGRTRAVKVERDPDAADRYRVSWDGVARVVDARPIDGGSLSLVMVDGTAASHDVRCVPTDRPGELDVHLPGAVIRALVDTGRGRFSGRAHQQGVADGEQAVSAPMPGKVVRVLVQPGDEVVQRQGVVVIEAMKMENELKAPKAGRVTSVSIEPGQSVEVGRVLVVIA